MMITPYDFRTGARAGGGGGGGGGPRFTTAEFLAVPVSKWPPRIVIPGKADLPGPAPAPEPRPGPGADPTPELRAVPAPAPLAPAESPPSVATAFPMVTAV